MPIITDPRTAEAKKQVRYRSSQLAVNNAIVNTKKNRYTTEIYIGLERYECSINNNTSLNQAAKILLGELGCSIGTESLSFSLEDDDTEIIINLMMNFQKISFHQEKAKQIAMRLVM